MPYCNFTSAGDHDLYNKYGSQTFIFKKDYTKQGPDFCLITNCDLK
jgi:hypothetical protein